LIDQLEREKELQESVSQSARDRLENMQIAIEDLKNENRRLKEKYDGAEDELRATKCEVKELTKNSEQIKIEAKCNADRLVQEKLELMETNTRDKAQFQTELLKRVDEIQSLSCRRSWDICRKHSRETNSILNWRNAPLTIALPKSGTNREPSTITMLKS